MCGGKTPKVEMTPEAQEQAKVDAELWNYYQTSYKPLIEKWTQRVTSPEIQEAEKKQVAGQIRGEIMRNVDPSKVTANPVENAKMLTGLARVETGAQVRGKAAVKSRQLGDIQNIINIGRGEATEASQGIGREAEKALGEEIFETDIQQRELAATENAIGSGIGTGVALLTRPKRKLTVDQSTNVVNPTSPQWPSMEGGWY